MTLTWLDPRWPGRARRIGAWGFMDEDLHPPGELLSWLEARLGPTTPRPRIEPQPAKFSAPRRLPDLGTPVEIGELHRLTHCRGQGLPDLLRLRSGTVPRLPDGVARPTDSERVGELLRRCARADVRVVPWGGGTSVTGAVNPPAGDEPVVVVDLGGMSGLLSLDERSGLATFGAGTLGPGVEEALAPRGLTLGHFPQSWELSTVGGWTATRSSGQESLGHGRIDDLVAGLAVVAPAGRLSLAPQPSSAAGPDLRRLVLGSEGRLGVITEVTLRVSKRPPINVVEAALLPTWEQGLAACRELVQGGHPLQLLRLSDSPETEVAMRSGLANHRLQPLICRWLRWRGMSEGSCLLLIGAAGTAGRVRRTLGAASSVLRAHGIVRLGRGPGRQWQADRFRHPYLRDHLLERGIATETLETAAPWSLLPALGRAVREVLERALEDEGERVAVLCHLSHPYPDGASLYFTFFFRDPGETDAAVDRWIRLKRAATEALVEAGGTVSHHHGVGRWHAPWLDREVGTDGLRLLSAAAAVLDPQGTLNPGILFDGDDRLEA